MWLRNPNIHSERRNVSRFALYSSIISVGRILSSISKIRSDKSSTETLQNIAKEHADVLAIKLTIFWITVPTLGVYKVYFDRIIFLTYTKIVLSGVWNTLSKLLEQVLGKQFIECKDWPPRISNPLSAHSSFFTNTLQMVVNTKVLFLEKRKRIKVNFSKIQNHSQVYSLWCLKLFDF